MLRPLLLLVPLAVWLHYLSVDGASGRRSCDFIEYKPGNINLIITVPHGGKEKNILDVRRAPKKELNADTFTMEIGRAFIDEYEKQTKKRPHLIVNKLHRSRLDPNREIGLGAGSDGCAKVAYKKYHKYINNTKNAMRGPGLLLDFHGHGHKRGKIEIGYNVSLDNLKNKKYKKDDTSVKALLNRKNLKATDLLQGNQSLGAMLNRKRFMSIPSNVNKWKENQYFKGGHTIQTHGSQKSGNLDAIQLEFPKKLRAKKLNGRFIWKNDKKFIKALVDVVKRFYSKYY